MKKNVIVIGGGVAGKLTAKALSSFFEEVIILEADQEYKQKGPRKRTPQSHQPHIVLKKGAESIEQLFPGFKGELIKEGSPVTNFTNDLKWLHFGYVKQPFEGDLLLNQQSRPLLEWILDRFVKQVTNVLFRYESTVESLLFDPNKTKVIGVELRSKGSNNREKLYADLVVDTSGFASKSRDWLSENGFEIKEEKVKIDLVYATRCYQLKYPKKQGWKNLLYSVSYPDNPNYGSVQLVEDGQYLVTVGGYGDKYSIATNEDFKQLVRNLPLQDVSQFIEKAEALTDVKVHRVPFQVRRRYDLAKHFPENFIVIGDANCRFDPLFAQGISVVAAEALELQKCLEREAGVHKGFEKKLHKKIAKIIATPWDLAITEALRNPEIKGKRSFILPIKLWYTKRVFQVSAYDPEVYMRLVRVMNLVQPSTHLFHPKVVKSFFVKRNKKSHNGKGLVTKESSTRKTIHHDAD
ncbi:FAD-dependent oxidoreductase [Mesobacillus foraminis]|uniref:FAD-dependent oxidoreductase n=1 Tax=Mesobacillus foraminis TaxID=279826 RepID=UPI0015D61EAA|nr:glutamate synthase [Mesobacillus foraminis]